MENMRFPEPFQFTQSNLHDYLTCPRRFELRYIRRMNWPALETAPVQEAERRMQLGSDFHHLLQQHALGLPVAALTAGTEGNFDLAKMWQNYLSHRPAELDQPGTQLFPEATLSTVLNGYRLAAKFDLVAVLPDDPPRVLIIDWKTNARRPKPEALRQHSQTRVYPFVFCQSGHTLTGVEIPPEQLSLQYWFANAPADPEIISYSRESLARDEDNLGSLIVEITTATEFPLTATERACRFCVYRSYCDRGDVPGPLDEFDDDDFLPDELDLDWEQVSEIAY